MPVLRPIVHLESVSRDYPGAWKQYASFLAQRSELGDWPSWCYCPMSGAYAIVSGGGDNRVALNRATEIARLAALAAWRPTQGVYRFDATLLEELWTTPLDGDIPHEHLQHLPEWGVYVELGAAQRERGLHGFFAHLEHDANSGRTELRLLIDTESALIPVPLHLHGTLEQAAAGFIAESNVNAAKVGAPVPAYGIELIRSVAGFVTPLVSVLLYLCAGDAETRPTRDPGRVHRDGAPLKRAKDGEPYAPPGRPEVWETGFRLGAAIRAARESEATGGTVRGHIRRAHWHTFLSGPRRGEQRRELRWLPPIPVKLDGDVQPTVRKVD